MRMTTCTLFFLFVLNAPAQETRRTELAGRPVAMTVVKAEDLSPQAWPQQEIELKQISATVTRDTNVYMLLQANGIAPDPGAFALVYDLNPALKDLNGLPPDASLQLPSVAGGEGLKKLQKDRDLVELSVDPETRHALNQRIEALQSLVPSIPQVTADANAQEQIKRLIGWYQQIERRFKRKTDPPLRQTTLIQLRNEADLLNSILEGALHQTRQLTGDEQRQIAAIYEDVKLEITQFGQVLAGAAPKGQSYYSVTVNIKGVDPKLNESLRVYFIYNGLFRPLPAQPPIASSGFAHLGSGQSENLLMKNYQIWAAKDGDSNHPLTPPYLLHIENKSPASLSVDLSLVTGARE